MTPGPYHVHETFEEDPRYDDGRGTWQYFVGTTEDGPLWEFKWYGAAEREAERLNKVAARRAAV